MEFHTCSRCKRTLRRELIGHLADGRPRYQAEDGTFWASANVCRNCAREDQRLLRGTVARRGVANLSPTKIGAGAENVAAQHFRQLGFTDVVILGGSGRPDLLCRDPQGVWHSVEVKKAVKDNAFESWRVGPVYPDRQQDQFVAIVLPNGSVHVSTMKEHLSSSRPCGFKGVTRLVRSYGLEAV